MSRVLTSVSSAARSMPSPSSRMSSASTPLPSTVLSAPRAVCRSGYTATTLRCPNRATAIRTSRPDSLSWVPLGPRVYPSVESAPVALHERILMGPGPSNPYPEVMAALARPVLGHLDPEFLALLDETCDRLRSAFRTSNAFTLPVSGTGSAGMEAVFVNAVESGDVVVVGVNG